MKKILWVTNLLTFALLFLVLVHYKVPKKIYSKLFEASVNDVVVKKDVKPKCVYDLKYFDFHYTVETDNPKIIMFGNSLIREGKWTKLLNRKDIVNRGIAGDDTRCMCERLKYLKGLGAKIWFIEGGINDLTYADPETIFNNYKELVEFVKAEKAIPVMNLVFYISPKAGAKYPERKDYVRINKMVSELNTKLLKYAKDNNIDYIDLNPEISTNSILNDDCTKDGVHLTDLSYSRWVSKIDKILIKHKI